MKKVLLSGIIISLALFLTGCENESKNIKTLVCTQSTSGVDIELSIDFDNAKIDDMRLNYNMDLSSYSDLQIEAIKAQDFCTVVKNSMLGFKDGFTNCKQDIKDKKLLITSNLDVNKITDTSLKQEGSIEEAKGGLEKEGYTCVIK